MVFHRRRHRGGGTKRDKPAEALGEPAAAPADESVASEPAAPAEPIAAAPAPALLAEAGARGAPAVGDASAREVPKPLSEAGAREPPAQGLPAASARVNRALGYEGTGAAPGASQLLLSTGCPASGVPGMEDESRFYSIDVECVASGLRHTDREVAQISLVWCLDFQVLLNLYVKPVTPVVSYITPLTGLTEQILEEHGMPLEEALAKLRSSLPHDAILVGQSIDNDVQWLELKPGEDFAYTIDLAKLWCAWNYCYQTWSVFSQEHLAKVLLGEDLAGGAHDAVEDAVKALKLFRLYRQLLKLGGVVAVESAKVGLLATPVTPPFKKRFPVYEGVCMGDRRACSCGAPIVYPLAETRDN